MDKNTLKIEVLKLEDGAVYEELEDDIIEYVDDGQYIEYEYIEEAKPETIEQFEIDEKTITMKLELDLRYQNPHEETFRCSNRNCKRNNLSFATQDELDNHNITHIRQIDLNTCPICDKMLLNAAKLAIHMETRHSQKSFECDNCGKIFKSKDNLRLHMSHHRKHFIVECKACKKTYKSMQSLRYHLRQHFEHHQCETCGKVFEHKKLLIGHVAAKHNQGLMVQCRYCTRMFSRNDVREAHEREIHKNGQVGSHFKCNECEEAFDLREDLTRHKITVHYTGQIHTCEECGKMFKKKSLLTMHMSCHQEKSIQCDVCLMMFTFVTGLAKHKKLGRCKGLVGKNMQDIATKEEIAAIAKQQLIDITVNPTARQESDVFDIFEEEKIVPEPKKVGRKPKAETAPKPGLEIAQSVSLYKKKPAVTIRTLTQREIAEQQKAAMPVIETTMSSSGRIIKRKLPMTFMKLPTRPVYVVKKPSVPFECDKCGVTVDTKLKLLNHIKSHRRSRVHQCESCDRIFVNLVSLKKHCATEHADANPFKEKRFQCDLCPKRYLTEFLLGQHKLSHENLKSQKCPECPFATNAIYDLKNHIKRIHYPSKQFTCPEEGCSKTFKRRCDMENHRNGVHSKVKVYVKCPTCDVIVLEKGLQSHMINRHSEKALNKPYKCSICGKAERYEKNLIRHYESVHEPQDRGISYDCSECGMIFYRRRDLTAHSFEHFTGVVHQCRMCPNKYKSKKELTNHLYTHRSVEFPCHLCNAIFQTKSGRAKHVRKHSKEYDVLEHPEMIENEPIELCID